MRLFLYAPLLAAIPGIAFAGPLTFDAALRQAKHDAPSIRAKTLGADAARSARGAAGALPDPTLGVSVESFPISGPLAFEPQRDDFTMARVGVSQDIPNLAKRHAQQARADSDIKAAEADTAVEVVVIGRVEETVCTPHKMVCAFAAQQPVVAGAAVDFVIARSAIQRVIVGQEGRTDSPTETTADPISVEHRKRRKRQLPTPFSRKREKGWGVKARLRR